MMKIVVSTPREFVNELLLTGVQVYQRAARYLVDRTPLQVEAISFAVVICLTAVVTVDSEDDDVVGEHLVECIVDCGREAAGDDSGNDRAMQVIQEVEDLLNGTGVRVMPGRLEL